MSEVDTTPTRPAFPPLDPDKAPAEQIYAAVKAAILSTELPPGAMISETEIGARFGASRTPVREAFAQLRADGLIVTRPSRGTYVSKLSEHALRQAQFLREALELGTITRLCAQGIPLGLQAALELCLDMQADAIDAGDSARFQQQDDRFHLLLARATGFARAESLLAREKAALDRLRVLSLSSPPHLQRLLAEHRAILSAVGSGDLAHATEVTQHHLRSVLATLDRTRTENEEYFE